ncbi:MAG: VOC family protein [Nocardioides sp.]
MASRIMNISLDCADPYSLALFWSKVLDRPMDPEDVPGTDQAGFVTGSGQGLLFLQVPEAKVAKNRLHLCLEPEQPRDVEVDRLLSLGATIHDDLRKGDGGGWAVMSDPEGNEFCVLLSAEERGDVDLGFRAPLLPE